VELFIALGAAFAASLLLTPVIRGLARSVGLIARPSQDRWHEKPTALLGGAAVYGGFLVGLGAALLATGRDFAQLAEAVGRPAVGILIAATLMFLVGLADDRLRLRPTTKLIFQGLAAGVVISFGVLYPVTPWYVVNVLITFFWFLALTNALNLLDNMDGVAVGVAGIAALFLAATFLLDGATILGIVCLALAGAAFGFLPYNFNRASIFMGDSGSLFLGAMLASLGAVYPVTASVSIVSVLLVPAAIAIIPILDTLLVSVTRTLAGQSISIGGRDHTTHRLVAIGLSERQVALLLYAFAACGGLLAMLLRFAPVAIGVTVGGIFLVGLLVLAAYLVRMHTYAPSELPAGRVTLLISDLLHKRRAFEVVLDLILFAIAYQLAYLLRWDASLPTDQRTLFEGTVAIAVVAKSLSFGVLGVYRGNWNQLNISDVHRIGIATVLGGLVTVTTLAFFFPTGEFSRSVLILDGVMVFMLTTAIRASFRTLDLVRHSLQEESVPVLIYGAGRAGELTVREMHANPDLRMKPVGFLDDNPTKRRRLVLGYPVLGGVSEAREIIASKKVQRVILSSQKLEERFVSDVCGVARELGVEVLDVQLQFRSRSLDLAATVLKDTREKSPNGQHAPSLRQTPLKTS